jgi:hypothetical protein
MNRQRKALQQRQAAGFKRWQPHRASQLQLLVGEEREWQVQALRCFALVLNVLRRQTEQVIDAERLQFGEVIAEGT